MPFRRIGEPFHVLGLPLGKLISAPFSPRDIAGLQLWLDFSDVSTLFQDSAKTNPVASDGDVIGAAEDKSDNGNDALQSTTSKKPLYKTGIQNGLSIGRFDGTEDFLQISLGVVSRTIVIVYQTVINQVNVLCGTEGEGVNTVEVFNNTTTLSFDGQIAFEGKFAVNGGGYSGFAENHVVAFSNDEWRLLFGEYKIGQVPNFRNIGRRDTTSASPNFFLAGDIGEAFIFNSVLTSADKASMETFLNNKWSIF